MQRQRDQSKLRHKGREPDRRKDRQLHGKTDRQNNRQTDRQNNSLKERVGARENNSTLITCINYTRTKWWMYDAGRKRNLRAALGAEAGTGAEAVAGAAHFVIFSS